MKNNSLYIKEIDAIRGLSAIIIILSHFSFLAFESGGINIFFVLSGYFIAYIALKKLDYFNLNLFIINRFLSLYPLIFITSSITFFFILYFGDLSKNFSEIFRSYISSLFLITNFYFIKIQNIYSLQNYLNPYLIFWSLSIIFQFYLIFGISVKFIFILKKRLNLIISYQMLFKVFFIIFITMFLLPLILNEIKGISDFYSTISRLWQFLLGILAYLITKLPKSNFSKILEKYNLILFSFILYIFWQINSLELNYFIVSIITSLSTFLILITLNYKFSNIFLRSNFLIFTGKISYPLILLHMPIIYFLNLYFINKSLIIIGTFCLSYLFSLCIFKMKFKVTLSEFNKYKNMIYSCIFLLFILIANGSIIYFKYKDEITKKENSIIEKIKSSYNYHEKLKKKLFESPSNQLNTKILYGKDGNDCFNNHNSLENCQYNKNGSMSKIYFIGGSNAANLSANIQDFFLKLDHSYSSLTFATCLYIQEYNKVDKFTNKIDELCNSKKLRKIKYDISKNEGSIIILSSRFQLAYHGSYFDDGEGNIEGKVWRYIITPSKKLFESQNLLDNLSKDIFELSIKNKIILIYPFPEFAVNSIKIKTINPKTIISSSYSSYLERSKDIIDTFDKIKSNNIYRIYPDKIFCNTLINDRCISSTEDTIYFEDASHLTKEGIKIINNEIKKTYLKIISDKF